MHLEDMDTSDSEHSDVNEDEEWVESGKQPVKRRISKNGSRSSFGLNQFGVNDSEKMRLEYSGEETVVEKKNNDSGLCCSCSKSSSCKTNKCQCRASGGICNSSCGCTTVKCSNREAVTDKEHDFQQSDLANSEVGGAGTDDTQKNHLASQGAMLLQSALIEAPTETNNNGGPRRKPLSDIGNTLVSFLLLVFHRTQSTELSKGLYSFYMLFLSTLP